MIEVVINGRQQTIAPATTIARLLEDLGMKPRYVAVEVNQQLVPRAIHGEHLIEAGDRLEIVTLVGGG